MERVKLSPTALASVAAILIILASVTSSYVVKIFSSKTIATKSSGTLASACTETPQKEKVFFVSCGGTF